MIACHKTVGADASAILKFAPFTTPFRVLGTLRHVRMTVFDKICWSILCMLLSLRSRAAIIGRLTLESIAFKNALMLRREILLMLLMPLGILLPSLSSPSLRADSSILFFLGNHSVSPRLRFSMLMTIR